MSAHFAPARLSTIRRQRNFTLRQLASLTGIGYQKIHHFEHGLQPRADELSRLAGALRCKLIDLQEVRDE
jgi:transcriptional regulator with XRE-family HTH domain